VRAFPKGSGVFLKILTHFAWAYAANNLKTGSFHLVFRLWVKSGGILK
jgi:hypothetical protein